MGRDKYGYEHRDDSEHDIGDSKPGDVGDSEGTIHDRARKNKNVIKDGKVQALGSTQSVSEVDEKEDKRGVKYQGSGQDQSGSKPKQETKALDDVVGKTVELEIDRQGGTEETLARYYNHQVHVQGGEPGEKKRIKLKEGNGFLIGEPVSSS
jgi:hypothetical protein